MGAGLEYGCAVQASMISEPVALHTPLREIMWRSAFSSAPMR